MVFRYVKLKKRSINAINSGSIIPVADDLSVGVNDGLTNESDFSFKFCSTEVE
jgi:hypothetical protein